MHKDVFDLKEALDIRMRQYGRKSLFNIADSMVRRLRRNDHAGHHSAEILGLTNPDFDAVEGHSLSYGGQQNFGYKFEISPFVTKIGAIAVQ